MNITIEFEREDLIKYIKDLLALKGFKPKSDENIVLDSDGNVRVTCVPCELLKICPACELPLKRPVTVPVFVESAAAPVNQDLVENSHDENEPIPNLDSDLGETLDPPSENEGIPAKEERGGGSMKSILAASKRLARERNKESRSWGNYMRGESTRPPKPGE